MPDLELKVPVDYLFKLDIQLYSLVCWKIWKSIYLSVCLQVCIHICFIVIHSYILKLLSQSHRTSSWRQGTNSRIWHTVQKKSKCQKQCVLSSWNVAIDQIAGFWLCQCYSISTLNEWTFVCNVSLWPHCQCQIRDPYIPFFKALPWPPVRCTLPAWGVLYHSWAGQPWETHQAGSA